MDEQYWWHGGWWFMWMLPVLIVLVFAVVLLRTRSSHRARDPLKHSDSPEEILDRRYAKGEISRQQYEEMKAVLHEQETRLSM